MVIIKSTKKGLEEIANLMKKELSKSPFNERASIKSILKSLSFYLKNTKIYILNDKEIKGVIIFQIEQWWEGPVIIIQDLVINSRFQNQGLGKKLMKFVKNYAKKMV